MGYKDPLKKTSDRKGLLGLLETMFRSFRIFSFLLFLTPLIVAYIIILGISLTPAIYFFKLASLWTEAQPILIQCFALATSLGLGFIAFIFAIILTVPIFNLPLLPLMKPCKTTWHSLSLIPWFYHNALVTLVRFTILDFITPSPIGLLFYRLMGMKMGKGVVINTTNIQDPCLITLGDYVTIGGSATMFAHYGMKGFLILDRLHIKKGTTIGLKASLMGDVVVGENCLIQAHAVILPKSRIPDGTTVEACI